MWDMLDNPGNGSYTLSLPVSHVSLVGLSKTWQTIAAELGQVLESILPLSPSFGCENLNFGNCEHQAPYFERGTADPQKASLLPHLSRAKSVTFCKMSQVCIPASQGSICHILASFRYCCWQTLVLVLLCCRAHPGAFLKCLGVYTRMWIPRVCKINFLLLHSLWHLFSVSGGRWAALALALEVIVCIFFKAEGEGVNSRGFI